MKLHRKMQLGPQDIFLNSNIRFSKQQSLPKPKPSPDSRSFLLYKQCFKLPLRLNEVKRRTRTLDSRSSIPKLKSSLRSKTISRTNALTRSQLQSTIIRRELIKEITPKYQRNLDRKCLTEGQKVQIEKYKEVYYTGYKARKHAVTTDEEGNYRPLVGDHIAYRFEVVRVLGSGAFGKVLEVLDHKHGKKYALKILKADLELRHQFQLQVQILRMVRESNCNSTNILQLKGNFDFRGHLCIITELLSTNLYTYIKSRNFQGLSVQVVRKILIQIMQSLLFLHHRGVIHCDIKPQNVVFKQLGKSGVKLVDFGSACIQDRKEFTYIQSRYYRSPQIVLIKPYDNKIDVWSLGCLIVEISTGMPLFPARTEEEQIEMLVATLGPPPLHFLKECERGNEFEFEKRKVQVGIKERMRAAPKSMLDLVEAMVKWVPEQRISIKEALLHQFIIQGLPEGVRKEHLVQMKGNNPYGLY